MSVGGGGQNRARGPFQMSQLREAGARVPAPALQREPARPRVRVGLQGGVRQGHGDAEDSLRVFGRAHDRVFV